MSALATSSRGPQPERRRPPRVVGILQARMGSTRCPGKVLAPILGRPMLAIIIERCRSARRLDELIVATSSERRDDAVADLARACGAGAFRGDEQDVLDRFRGAAAAANAEVVVRLTGDDPFVDGAFIDAAVEAFLASTCPYLDTTTGSFPVGMAVQVFGRTALETAWRLDGDPASREHVVAYFDRHPQLFPRLTITCPDDLSHLRWTVDTADDLRRARAIFERLGRCDFRWQEAVAVEHAAPAVAAADPA